MTVTLPRFVADAAVWDSQNEAELIERAKRDRDAFSILYRYHYADLCSYVFRRTGDAHVTEDLVSDVFYTALTRLHRFQYRGIPLRFWLYRIATRSVNRWARARRRALSRTVAHDPMDGIPCTPSETAGGFDAELAGRALRSLSAKHQAVLSLHYLEGLSVSEVAATLGCREGTVKSRLARGRIALRDVLTKQKTWRKDHA